MIVAIIAFPIGLATAVYLEEYASDTRFTRFIQINIRNLAGVPSVVYGLLGLSVFVAADRRARRGTTSRDATSSPAASPSRSSSCRS